MGEQLFFYIALCTFAIAPLAAIVSIILFSLVMVYGGVFMCGDLVKMY